METYLDPEEIKLMEEAASCVRDRLLIRLLFRLGCRVSEALALTVDDIDMSQSLVTIVHLKSRARLLCPHCQARLAKAHQFCPVCGNKVEKVIKGETEHRRLRALPVDRDTLQMLEDYIRRGGPVIQQGKKLLFGINRFRAWQVVRDCAEKAGMPRLLNPETGRMRGVSPHRLRDAFAVHAVKTDDSGDALRLLQEHLGHASFNTTARYRKVGGSEHRDWYQRLWEGEGR